MSAFPQDLKFGLRMLVRKPLLTIGISLSLAERETVPGTAALGFSGRFANHAARGFDNHGSIRIPGIGARYCRRVFRNQLLDDSSHTRNRDSSGARRTAC